METDFISLVSKAKRSLISYGVIFDLEKLQKQLLKLKAISEEENFWSDNDKARKVMVEISELDQSIKLISDFEKKNN